MDEKKAVTMDQLLESARQGEALTMQFAQAAQAELNKRPTTEQINAAVAELFTSVSDGKALIASAITDKGVATAQDAPFQTMRENILAIQTGYKIDLSADLSGSGTVSGGGRASAGMKVTVTATDNLENGYKFEGWKENGQNVSTAKAYRFTVGNDRSLTASMNAYDFWFRAATLPSSASWCSVTYGNGKFVAVASNSNKAAYSTERDQTA